MSHPSTELSAADLLALGLSFWNAKALLTAVELNVFAELAEGSRTSPELSIRLDLHGRGVEDLLDALVALGLLTRDDGRYANGDAAAAHLVPGLPGYVGGALELANSRLYPTWGSLTKALRTGLPQNEAQVDDDYYDNLTRHEERLRVFLRAMSGLSMASSRAIAEKFPWSRYGTFVDIGGAQGELSVGLARRHPHLRGITFDLPPVRPFFEEYVSASGLADRLSYVAGDFFNEALPSGDVIVMGHVLHNWNLEQKKMLITKAYAALPPGGVLVVYEALIDDERSQNAFGLLMSLNMLLVTAGGFVFTGQECLGWMRDAGFVDTRVEHLQGPDSMVIGMKPA
jgi:cyclopropane fatty-acyl-phospholipid synthase-like methyltransferase